MKIAILGTGNVGQTFAEKFISLGHEVIMGTRDVDSTLARQATDNYGSLPFREWYSKNPAVQLNTFDSAADSCEIIVNALQGAATLSVFKGCRVESFNNKIIIDVANPLDFGHGFPPSLIAGLNNTNSLGEALQELLGNAKIVKTLNTMYCGIMVNPNMISGGQHTNYICGNDENAKRSVIDLLLSFGWEAKNILDLGDITNARGTESTLLLWTRIYGATKNGAFNFSVVK